jgi:hypothetical protein
MSVTYVSPSACDLTALHSRGPRRRLEFGGVVDSEHS